MNKNNNSKPKQILFLLHLPPPVHGSSMMGKWIKESEILRKNFPRSRYINLLASKTVADSGRISINKLVGFVGVIITLLKQLLIKRPDVCYLALSTTGVAFYKDVILVVILKIFKIRRIYHLHNKGVRNASRYWYNRWLYSYVFRDTKVILLSNRLYSDVSQFVLEKYIVICPNGVPPVKLFQNVGISQDEPVSILFFANLIETKGVFILLQALYLLKERYIPFKGIFVGGEGDISTDRFQQELVSLGLQKQVSYIGKKYASDKDAVFAQANIFAFPTYYSNETFGLVNLEAMQHGLPIISTPEGGIADIVEEGVTGYLVPQKDVAELANRLQALIQDPALRERMGEAGRNRYESYYTLAHFENRLSSILKEL